MTWAQYEDTYAETREEHRGPFEPSAFETTYCPKCDAAIDVDGWCMNECPKEKA